MTLTDQIVHASRAIVVHAEAVLDGDAYQVPAARLHELEDLLARRDDPDHDLRSDHPAPIEVPVGALPPPVGHRWVEVSLPCPECGEGVEVLTSAGQSEEELDDQVHVHSGDVWWCGGRHVGSVSVVGQHAYLGAAAFAGRDQAWAEAVSAPPPILVRAPMRRGAE